MNQNQITSENNSLSINSNLGNFNSENIYLNLNDNVSVIDKKNGFEFFTKALISDIVYTPKETNFLQSFSNNKKVYGFTMLVEQAIPCFRQWFGFNPKVDRELLNKINSKIT